MPFAGHPTLGTAHVVRALRGGDAVTLAMPAGVIPVTACGDTWTLRANPPAYGPVDASPRQLAEMLGLGPDEVLEGARRVNTGAEQLLVPLRDAAAVARCAPVPALMDRWAQVRRGDRDAYVFADSGSEVRVRFFFRSGSAVVEDPATGSACANLGGWLLGRGTAPPFARVIRQGDEVRRPSRLALRVEGPDRIFVSGEVVEIGRGVVSV